MRRVVMLVLMLMVAVMAVGLFGCSERSEDEITVEIISPKPEQLSLEEIESRYTELIEDLYEGTIQTYQDNGFIIIDDDKLWEKMHVQLFKHSYATFALFAEPEKIVTINPGWGSDVVGYEVVDFDDDGEYEMVGFYDWGSGIVRSIPFVLYRNGEFADEQRLEIRAEAESVDWLILLYENYHLADNGKTILADVCSFDGEKLGQLTISSDRGRYIFKYSN